MNHYHVATRHNILVMLAIPTALLLLTFPVVRGDCLVGDIMYQTGQSTGYFGYSCVNETHFEGSQGYCAENGEIEDQAVVLGCSESVPYCVQCGTPQKGEALCLSSPEVPDHCDDDHVGPPRPDETAAEEGGESSSTTTDCLVGDIMYQPGDSIGVRGFSCINETHYNGSEGVCNGETGDVVDQDTVLQCYEGGFCVQCGSAETGEALCLSTQDVPDHCDENHVGPPRPEESLSSGVTAVPLEGTAGAEQDSKGEDTTTSSASSSWILRYGESWMMLGSVGTIWLFSLIPDGL